MSHRHLYHSLLISLFPVLISAQAFFPSDSAVWKEAQRWDGFGPPLITMEQYTLYGDTIEGGVAYKYLHISGEGTNLLRIDSLEKRVYVSPRDPDGIGVLPFKDNLLYDFGVSVGDTVRVLYLRSGRDTLNWVVFKDSTMEFSGQQRRFIDVYYTGNGFRTDRWVEGIGSLSGFLAPMSDAPQSFESWYELVCFTNFGTGYQYEPDSLTYPYINCNASLKLAEPAHSEILIYPTPFQSHLVIENQSKSDIKYRVVSTSGDEIFRGKVFNSDLIELETEGLSNGLYMLFVFNKNEMFIRKIIKY